MPRVIVTTETHRPEPSTLVLLDEQVASIHLGSGHAAAQLVERLAWAISDAEDLEQQPGAKTQKSPTELRSARTPARRAQTRRRAAIAA